MTRFEDIVRPELTPKEQAVDIGYKEGREIRTLGGLAEHLNEQRELMETGNKMRRGPGHPLYVYWRKGFDAGYEGGPKPTV